MVERAVTEWPTGGNVQEKWEAVKPALTKSAEALLGTEDRRHPDWFCASADKLKPVPQQQNEQFAKWLATKCTDDLAQFRGHAVNANKQSKKLRTSGFRPRLRRLKR